MKRPQARFHLLAGLTAQMGIKFIAPPEGPHQRNSGEHTPRKVFRVLGGWRRRKKKIAIDYDRMNAAAERRLVRAAKRHNDYLKCLANNPCLKAA